MKRFNRITLLVICFLFLIMSGTAGAQQIPCVCLDENGIIINYQVNDPASVYCYACTADNVCQRTSLTLLMCRALNATATAQAAAAAAAAAQPVVTQEPPAPAAPAPVIEQPAPVVEPPAPVAPAPVVEQPAPVVEPPAPVAPARVVEQPAPVVEQPAPAAPAPVVEQPAPVVEPPAPAAPAPVVEQLAPVVEPPAPAAPAPVVEQPAPVVEQPAPAAPVVEQPASVEVVPVIVTDEPEPVPGNGGSMPIPVLLTSPENDSKDEISDQKDILTDDVPAKDVKEEPAKYPDQVLSTEPEKDPEQTVTEESEKDPEQIPSEEPTKDPEQTAAEEPTKNPEQIPSEEPTKDPEQTAAEEPTKDPEQIPSEEPTKDPEQTVIEEPTKDPEQTATEEPTKDPEEGPSAPMLRSGGISIEGKLKDIALNSPSGETFTSTAVPFTWVYTLSDTDKSVEVYFSLTMNILNLENNQTTVSTTVVSSASCSNSICEYTAGSELSGFKKAEVTWTVSGEYDDGGSTVTVNAANPAERSFKLDVKSATATPVPTATPTPTATPKPKPAPKAPVQECPVGRYTVRSLGFYWAPSANAEVYTVSWHNDRGQSGSIDLSNNDPTCKNGRCIAYSTLPGVGKYAWIVTAKNSTGAAPSKEMYFEIAPNVSTPTPYLPNGTVFNSTYPAFQWEDVEDGVFEYRIQIVGKYDGRIRYDRWFSVKDIYVGNGVCYVKTDLFLPAGSYSWRVLGRNADFSSRWSSWLDFYVQCDYCNLNNVYYGNYANTVPSTSYPTAVITTMSPEFQWRTLTGAAFYQVKVMDAKGKEVISEQVPSSYCTVEMCTWDPGKKLPGNGNYTWTVSGYGPSGGFWGSSSGAFTVQAQIVINPMSFISPEPNGYLNPISPLIIWTDPGDTAVLFSVQIFDGNNNSLLSAELDRDQAWCDGRTCSIAFQTIPDGLNYRIAITPYSDYNTQGETIELVFSKGGRSIRLESPKEGSVVQARPLFRWLLEDGEDAAYDLILTDSENNVTFYSPLVCGSGGVTCEDGTAYFSPAESLAAGSYTAVLDISKDGVNGEPVKFTVQ